MFSDHLVGIGPFLYTCIKAMVRFKKFLKLNFYPQKLSNFVFEIKPFQKPIFAGILRAETRTLIGGGGGGVYSYNHVLTDKFLFKSNPN